MNCDEARQLLEHAEAADLEPSGLSEHLRGCEACARFAEELKREIEVLTNSLAPLPSEERWRNVKTGLARRLEKTPRRRRTDALRAPARPSAAWAWVCAGAAALLALGVFVALNRNGASDPDSAPPIAEDRTAPKAESPTERAASVAQLQESVKSKQLLEDIGELQVALKKFDDPAARSAAEDAEHHLERLMAIDRADPELSEEVLYGIQQAGVAERLEQANERIRERAPEPVKKTLDAAARALAQAERMARPSSRPEAGLAEAQMKKGQYQEALAEYRRQAERSANEHRAALARHSEAFILQKKMAQNEEARLAYGKLVQRHGGDAISNHALFHMGQAFEQAGGTKEAIGAYEDLMKKAPGHEREAALKQRLEFLRKKEKGLAAEPPGWGHGVGPIYANPMKRPEKPAPLSHESNPPAAGSK